MGAERMVEGWMSSIQGHRENLLNGKWTYIGLGYCPADDLHIKRSYFKGKVAGALATYLNGATVTECSVADDVAGDASYAEAVTWAVNNNVTSCTSASTFSPDMTCTRGQIVTFLLRAIK